MQSRKAVCGGIYADQELKVVCHLGEYKHYLRRQQWLTVEKKAKNIY